MHLYVRAPSHVAIYVKYTRGVKSSYSAPQEGYAYLVSVYCHLFGLSQVVPDGGERGENAALFTLSATPCPLAESRRPQQSGSLSALECVRAAHKAPAE